MGKSYRDTRGKFSDHRKFGKARKKIKSKRERLMSGGMEEKPDETMQCYEDHVLSFYGNSSSG